MSKETELWQDFPKTLPEFERRFSSESACRRYLMEARWGDRPLCGKCHHERVYELSNGLWDCSQCGHQTSLTSGTPMEGTRKDLRVWFRAIWEVVSRKNGISAKDLQRVMGFGSYKTAWSWLHKIRRCLVRTEREPLRGSVQVDEGYVGGRGEGNQRGRSLEVKDLIMVAAEVGDGRVRLEHAPHADSRCAKEFLARHLAPDAAVTTDGGSHYNELALAGRTHNAHIQTKSASKKQDPLQLCHWTLSNLKRWWLGTHHGAISSKHLQAYLDEFTFRHNRRKTKGVGRLVARAIENLVAHVPVTMRQIIDLTKPCPHFAAGTPDLRG